MLGFFGRLNHRDAVMKNLDALLLMYPRKRQFARDFPELKKIIRNDFEAEVPPTLSALAIAARILASILGQLTEVEKQAVLTALGGSDRAQLEALAVRRIGGERDQRGDQVQFAARLVGIALVMAAKMTGAGALGRGEYEGFAAAVARALGAKDERALASAFALPDRPN